MHIYHKVQRNWIAATGFFWIHVDMDGLSYGMVEESSVSQEPVV